MSAPPPNILWIITTQWRAQATGYAGDPNARTPQLDAFARQAINHTQAVTPHPFGPFARAALLTGVPSPENGVSDYFDPLPIGARTIAHELAACGYTTAFFGKWHLWKRDPAAPLVGEAHARIIVPPEARGGFEFWEGFESGFLLEDPLVHGTRCAEPIRLPGYQSDVIGGRAAEWMAARESPWFCVVSLEPPHPPYDATVAGIRARDPQQILLAPNVPRGTEVEQRARQELAGYYAQIEATDRAIGTLLARVGHDPGIIFTSVHGDMHGAHGLFRKGWPHEESIRVPLLVRPPRGGDGTRPAGSSTELVSLIDLPRWTREWATAPKANAVDPRTPSEVQRISMPSVVRLPHQCDRAWRGVRSRTRKLVLNPDGSPWLYFDLERDPGETRNLVNDAAHAADLSRWRELV